MRQVVNDTLRDTDLALCCTACGCARYVVVLRDGLHWLLCVRCEHDMTMEAFGAES